MTDVQDLAAYLSGKGVTVHRANGTEVTAHCLFCADGDPKGKGRLYLNTDSWLWDCKRCGEQGNRKTLLAHFGDEDSLEHVKGQDPMLRRRILTEAAHLAHEMLLGNKKMLDYLRGRGLDDETIVRKQYGYVPRNTGLSAMLPGREHFTYADLIGAGLINVGGQEFFNGSILIPYWSHGSVVQLREKKPEGKYRTPAGDATRVYNADSLRGADDVLVTEGEFDADMVEQALRGAADPDLAATAVVGLPGAGVWPEGFIESLESARRVFIGLDPDETGKKWTTKLAEELGSRARIVRLPETLPKCDWNDYLKPVSQTNVHGGHGWADIQSMLVEADLAGKRMFTVADAQAKWTRQRTESPGLKLGFTSLDAILRPGLKPGQLMIPLAKTGCIHGDAEILINRGGGGKRIALRDLVHRFNGGKPASGPRWRSDIPTLIQREVDGFVRLARIKNAWHCGDKQTYAVTTETGRTTRATDEHPFLTERGWLRLDQLVVGDLIHVRGEQTSNGRRRTIYAQRTGLFAHPFAQRRDKPAGECGGRVPYHRLVAEAQINSMETSDLIALVRRGGTDGLRFLDPQDWAVHHIDHDHTNNEPSNLKVLTHQEHATLHAEGGTDNVQRHIAHERVVSIEAYGVEPTYDIEVADEPHNFIADGFVVHNTGKTVWLSNVAHNVRSRRVLYLSLEMTAPEVFEHIRRIHHFWFPTSTASERNLDYSGLRIVDQNRIGRGDLRDLVREFTDDVGSPPDLVLVDYLQYYARGFRGSSTYEKVSDAVMELKAVSKEESLAIICPSQVSRSGEDGKPLQLDDARDSGVVEETGDFVLSLFRPDQQVNKNDPTGAPLPQTGGFSAQLLKSRHGGKGRLFNMRMSLMSLAICDQLDRRNVMRIDQENALVRGGKHYDDYRAEVNSVAAQQPLVTQQGVLIP